VARRREYLPLKRSPPERHPDSGVLLEVHITGKATVTRTRQSYVRLRVPLRVARENLVGLPMGTAKLEPRAFAVVLAHLRKVCPGVVVPLGIEPPPVVSPALGDGRGEGEDEEGWVEESSEMGVAELDTARSVGKRILGALAARAAISGPALVATVATVAAATVGLASWWWLARRRPLHRP
jgi:hypothetical protein